MDNTLYKSPVRLVSYAGEPIHPYTQQAITRTRKKLQAELLLGDADLVVEAVTYSRNEVVALLDDPALAAEWSHHCAIYSQACLLDFLEVKALDVHAMQLLCPRLPFTLLRFMEPYFIQAFSEFSGLLLKGYSLPASRQEGSSFTIAEGEAYFERFARLEQLLLLDRYVQGGQYKAYQRIHYYFEDLQHQLRNLNWDKFQQNESALHFIFDQRWLRFANALPGDFQQARDRVAEQLISLAIAFQKAATWNYLWQLMKYLEELDTAPHISKEVTRLRIHFHKNVKIVGKKSNSSWGWKGYGGVFWIIIMIIRVILHLSDPGKSGNPNYVYTPEEAPLVDSAVIREQVSADHQVNKANRKTFLQFLQNQHITAAQVKQGGDSLKNGDIAFADAVNQLQLYTGEQEGYTLTIENQTPYACVGLFFLDPGKPAASNKQSLFSAYIAPHRQVQSRFAFADKAELNFLLGEQWVQLREVQAVNLADRSNFNSSSDVKYYTYFPNMQVNALFRNASGSHPDNYYLQHTLQLTSSAPLPGTSPGKVLFIPSRNALHAAARELTMHLTWKNNRLVPVFSGNVYVSERIVN